MVEIIDPARRADVHENSDPDPIGEETPRVCLGSTAVRCGLAVAGAKWRRFGDEGEAMLFVVGLLGEMWIRRW